MVVRAPVPLAVASHGCRAGSSSGCPGSSPAALRAGARLAPRDFASEAPRLAAPLPPPTTVEGRRKGKKMLIFFLKNVVTFRENVDQHFYENVDETFRKNVDSNVFSRKMLIFAEKCWFNISKKY
jgi:hypothetical protein